MGVAAGTCVAVHDASAVSEARRTASDLARRIGFDAQQASDLAIVVTEIASNIHKHAGDGCVVMHPVELGGGIGVDVLGLDNGPGIADLPQSRRDGFSTAGTAGTGLGAIGRLALFSDVYSAPGRGTAVLARMAQQESSNGNSPFAVGGLCLPKNGEDFCGDDWFMRQTAQSVTIAVSDGLGHGMAAADASGAARRVFSDTADMSPAALLERMHRSMRATRGAAVAIANIDLQRQVVDYAGVGNVVALLLSDAGSRHCVSHNGIVGGDRAPRIQPFSYPVARDPILIMHSDGLSSHWNLDAYAGLTARDPGLIAGVLYRDFSRARDDVTVVVVKGRQL
jgi:anti-sigma regulatory factor (Ser/Thr protein kinase)